MARWVSFGARSVLASRLQEQRVNGKDVLECKQLERTSRAL